MEIRAYVIQMSKKIIIGVTICFLVLASLSLTGCLNGNGATQDTPEGAFELYVKAAEANDINKAMRYVDFSASNHEYVVEMRNKFLEDDSEDIEDADEWDSWKILSVKPRSAFDSDVKEYVGYYDEIYEKYDMIAEDFALVEYEFTYHEDGEEETDTGEVLMVQIRGKWYISLFPAFAMFDDWDWGDDWDYDCWYCDDEGCFFCDDDWGND